MVYTCNMNTLFDFYGRWDEVIPHLDHSLVQRALNVGMECWCHKSSQKWDPKRGPWYYSHGNEWPLEIESRFFEVRGLAVDYCHWCIDKGCPSWDTDPVGHKAWLDTNQEAMARYDELTASLEPQPNTPDWYRCYGACYDLAPWNGALGMVMFPDREWEVINGGAHAAAKGGDLYMDLVCSSRGEGVEVTAAAVQHGRHFTVEEVIKCLEVWVVEGGPPNQ